jgi:hypothetical protein
VYERIRRLHRATYQLISLVQVERNGETLEHGNERRLKEFDRAWDDFQDFHLLNGLYFGQRLERLITAYSAGVTTSVAKWNAGRRERGNPYDWSDGFNGLKALGETTLEQIFAEIRLILGIDQGDKES